MQCYYLNTGVCNPNDNNTCYCSDYYQGDLCTVQKSTTTPTSLQSAASTNWTVIVAVISAVAGLLLIIALTMITFYIVSRYRRRRLRSQPK